MFRTMMAMFLDQTRRKMKMVMMKKKMTTRKLRTKKVKAERKMEKKQHQ